MKRLLLVLALLAVAGSAYAKRQFLTVDLRGEKAVRIGVNLFPEDDRMIPDGIRVLLPKAGSQAGERPVIAIDQRAGECNIERVRDLGDIFAISILADLEIDEGECLITVNMPGQPSVEIWLNKTGG